MPYAKKSVFVASALGALFSLGVLVLMAALGAAIAFSLKNPLGAVKPLSIAMLLAAAAISAFIARRRSDNMLTPIISSLMLVFTLLITGIIIGDGGIGAGVLINYACYIAVSVLFSYLGGHTKARKRRRKIRRR